MIEPRGRGVLDTPWVHDTSATPARVLWRWDNVMASSALRSALRSTACMQPVDLKAKLRLRLTGRRRRSVGNCGATPGLPRSGAGGYEPVRAQQLAERRRRWDGRFKLARQPDLRDCVGKSLAMGHSPEQIAGRLALEHGRVIISHESIYRFIYHRAAQKDYWHRLLPRRKRRRGHRDARTQPRQPHQTTALDHRTPRRGRRPRDAGPLGSRLHAVRPMWPRGCWFSTNDKPASTSFSIRSIEKLSSPPGPSLVNSANFHRRCAKPSASTTETSSPSITGFTKPSASKPSSAIPIAPGKRAAWKTPSGAYDARCPAKLTSSSSRQPPSSGTFSASTIPHANAWTSRRPPRHSQNSNQSLHFKRDSIPRLRGV